jgi:hypothetical protein
VALGGQDHRQQHLVKLVNGVQDIIKTFLKPWPTVKAMIWLNLPEKLAGGSGWFPEPNAGGSLPHGSCMMFRNDWEWPSLANWDYPLKVPSCAKSEKE